MSFVVLFYFVFSSRRRHTRCALVTGVQTCALPIFQWAGKWLVKSQALAPRLYRHSVLAACKWQLSELPVLTDLVSAALRVSENHHFRLAKIGRASCRERVCQYV